MFKKCGVPPQGGQVSNPRFAFVKAGWHHDIVDRALDGFREVIDPNYCDVFDVPGAVELPLRAQTLARSGRYDAIVAAALVVDGGIYRHDFVASAVVNGLIQVLRRRWTNSRNQSRAFGVRRQALRKALA
jgi:6,7-dimethyl-8-ribityllumazine synthase